MIVEISNRQKHGGTETRVIVWPFAAHEQYSWQAFIHKHPDEMDKTPPGYPGCGYVDIRMPGDWLSASHYQRMREILTAVSKNLGVGHEPAQITEILPQADIFDLMLGSNLDSNVQGWAWKNRTGNPVPGTYLWGIFFYPKHSSNGRLHLAKSTGDTIPPMLDFLLLLGTGKIQFDGDPPCSDSDFLMFLQTVSREAVLRLPATFAHHMIKWGMKDSLEYLCQANGKIMWHSDLEPSVIDKWGITPDTHPFLSALSLTRTGTAELNLSNVKLNDTIVAGLRTVSLTQYRASLCDRGNSLLSNPWVVPFLASLRSTGGVPQDQSVLLLLEELLLRPYNTGTITSLIKTMAGTNVTGRHRRYNRGDRSNITLLIYHILSRGDVLPEGVGNILLGLVDGTTLESYLDGSYYYTRKKLEHPETPPLTVYEGVLRQLLRKPVRMGMLGEWLSDACINIDTTPVLQEMPTLIKVRLAKPKWPNGIEYWIKQMARDHDKKKEKEETSDNA